MGASLKPKLVLATILELDDDIKRVLYYDFLVKMMFICFNYTIR